MNIEGHGYSEANSGKLTIGVYSLLHMKKFIQIAMFECSAACPVSYSTTGKIVFHCTDQIRWAAKCNTYLADPTKQDWAGSWNNTTVGK
jgi:hypothetical protein